MSTNQSGYHFRNSHSNEDIISRLSIALSQAKRITDLDLFCESLEGRRIKIGWDGKHWTMATINHVWNLEGKLNISFVDIRHWIGLDDNRMFSGGIRYMIEPKTYEALMIIIKILKSKKH